MTQFNLGAAFADYKQNQELHVLDHGTYTIQITTAKSKTSKNGNPTIVFFGKVVTGPHAGKRVGLGSITYTENGSFYFFRTLRGFGINDDFMQQANTAADPIKVIADALVGRTVDVTVSVDTYNGEQRNRIEGVQLSGAAASTPTPVPPAPAQAPVAPPVPAPPADPSVPPVARAASF